MAKLYVARKICEAGFTSKRGAIRSGASLGISRAAKTISLKREDCERGTIAMTAIGVKQIYHTVIHNKRTCQAFKMSPTEKVTDVRYRVSMTYK